MRPPGTTQPRLDGARETELLGVLAIPPCPGLDGPTMYGVNTREQIREFLASRRAKITPEQARLPAYGGERRAPGLRRKEVALLAKCTGHPRGPRRLL
jgi:hypothetical protein